MPAKIKKLYNKLYWREYKNTPFNRLLQEIFLKYVWKVFKPCISFDPRNYIPMDLSIENNHKSWQRYLYGDVHFINLNAQQ